MPLPAAYARRDHTPHHAMDHSLALLDRHDDLRVAEAATRPPALTLGAQRTIRYRQFRAYL